jgi:hypothetical protein
MTLERVRSGVLRIGIRVWSRLFVVWSELLTIAPGLNARGWLTHAGRSYSGRSLNKWKCRSFSAENCQSTRKNENPNWLVVNFAQTRAGILSYRVCRGDLDALLVRVEVLC